MDIEEKIKESFACVSDKYVRRIFENLTEEEIEEAAQNFEEYCPQYGISPVEQST